MNKKKTLLTISATLLACAVSVMGTLAILSLRSDSLINTFVAQTGLIVVPEEGEEADKYFNLKEQVATKQTDGSFAIAADAAWIKAGADGQQYDQIVSGEDIAKNPQVSLKLQNNTEVYLYIEVDPSSDFAEDFAYQVDTGNWTSLTGVENVYYYTGNNHSNGVITANNSDAFEVANATVLTDNKVVYNGDNDQVADTYSLSFKAYVAQAGGQQDAKSAWDAASFR